MLIKPILILLLFTAASPICGPGCLKCTPSNDCLLPDLARLYKLDNETAVRTSLSNCLLVDLSGKCLSCSPGTSLDAATSNCVAVAEVNKVPNCEFYGPGAVCLVCAKDHQLSAATCSPVGKKIDNCETYSVDGNCAGCAGGFLLGPGLDSCVARPNVADCSGYSYVVCESCGFGFAKTLNTYLNDFSKISTDAEKVGLLLLSLAYADDDGFLAGRTACVAALAANCVEFASGLNKCVACRAGHYLTDESLCLAFPDNPIANCVKYSSATSCVECRQGHYFKTGVCTAIPEISLKPDCVGYDATLSTVRCIKCSTNFYIPSNDCVERDKSKDNKVANCAEKDTKFDKCAVCNPFFRLADDGLECMARQANCETYAATNSGSPLKCSKCLPGFYLKTNTVISDNVPLTECLAGDKDECDQYAAGSSTNCLACKTGFVLENGGCASSNVIPGCSVFSTTDKTKCQVCSNTGDFNFVVDELCSEITNPVANCAAHSGGSPGNPLCSACDATYELSANQCTKIQIANCLTTNGVSVCDTCEKGYAKSRNLANCRQALSYMNNNCEVNSTVDESNAELVTAVTCSVCKEHNYPVAFLNQFACVSNEDLDEFATGSVKNDCLKYDDDMKCVQCDPASSSKFLKTDRTCDSSCDGTGTQTTFNRVELDPSSTNHQIKRWNICVSPVATELVKAPNMAATGMPLILVGCPPAHITTVVLTIAAVNYTFADPRDDAVFPYVQSPFTMFPEVTCIAVAGKTIHGSASAALVDSDNCEYYATTDNTDYTCVKCKHGYTSTINDSDQANACALDNNCQSDRLYNLGVYWEKLFSCHLCTNNGIPFIAFATTTDTDFGFLSFKEWDTSDDTDNKFEDATGSKKNIECLNNVPATFGKDAASYGVDDNCALGVVLTNPTAQTVYTAGSQVFKLTCAACKPGYAKTATTNATNTKFAAACTAIANCAKTGKLANACEICADNFIHSYSSGNIVFTDTASTCISVPGGLAAKLENCWAATADPVATANAKECAVCKKGFHLNKDKYCEQVIPANCKSGQFRFSEHIAEGTTDETGPLNWGLYQQGMGVGCNECEASHSAIKIVSAQNVCVSSNWIGTQLNSVNSIDDTEFVPNCRLYKGGDAATLTCEECDTGFVIKGSGTTANGEECFAGNSLQNCKIASSASTCIVCANDTFGLVKGSCSLGGIQNCKAYNLDVNSTFVKCTTCVAGFYLTSENKCQQAGIPNCEIFAKNEPFQCSTCAAGHKLIPVNNNIKYCYPIPDSLGCKTVTISNDSAGGKIDCDTCSNPRAAVPAAPAPGANTTVCMPFVLIPNCVSYDAGTSLSTSTFKCTGCSEKFFLSTATNECKERENLPNKCTAYNSSKDECVACGSDSYLFNSDKDCKDFPEGILGCLLYNGAALCGKCQADRYLNDNQCPQANPLLDNCVSYSSAGVCSACLPDHLLANNACARANAGNCLTFASLNACATCPPKSGLETSAGITSCVEQAKSNCVSVSDAAPYECTLCEPGFYLDGADCAAPAGIQGCSVYAGRDTCAECVAGSALAVNKKSCEGTGVIGGHVPANCGDARAVDSPVCSRCGPGFFFEDDGCVPLCEESVKKGCFTCELTDKGTCFLCVSGFYMESDGVCKEEGGGSGGGDGEKAGIRGVLGLLVVMMTLMVK